MSSTSAVHIKRLRTWEEKYKISTHVEAIHRKTHLDPMTPLEDTFGPTCRSMTPLEDAAALSSAPALLFGGASIPLPGLCSSPDPNRGAY